MPKSNIYVGLEIGTSKICAVVGEVRGDGAIKILGVGQYPSSGVRKGEIVDIAAAQTCLHEALVNAEERSDIMVAGVCLAVTGAHIESVSNRGCIRVADENSEISPADLEEVKAIARDVAIPEQNAVVHTIVQHYYVDDQEKVLNPVGMLGQKLEADYHIIHGVKNRIQNAIRCVREISMEVDDIVFSPLAAAQVVLNREAKQQGSVLIDIGGGTSDYILYLDGAVVASGSLGLGGDHITNDLSVVLKVPRSKAEKLKLEEGSVANGSGEVEGVVDLEAGSHFAGGEVEKSLVNQVIAMRLREMLELIYKRLASTGYLKQVGKGIYLTGGTSLLHGIEDLTEDVFGLPVQKGGAASMTGPAAIFESPQYAMPVGLVRYAQLLDQQRPSKGRIKALGQALTGIFGGGR
ncbi:MAG: cell division protein FtsA [Verrucomicrobiales bacterium]|nr:cell division protein FtsA [Verrucomicrobiales bacterium]